jgi:hypothetical protein
MIIRMDTTVVYTMYIVIKDHPVLMVEKGGRLIYAANISWGDAGYLSKMGISLTVASGAMCLE